jgi:hypothetical protein
MLRKRVEANSRFTSLEVTRFSADADHLSDFFQLDTPSSSKSIDFTNVRDEDIDANSGSRCVRALQTMREVRNLMYLNVESEEFLLLCRSIVRRFYFESRYFNFSGWKHLIVLFCGRYRDIPQTLGVTNVSQNLLTAICSCIRPDANERVGHLIQIIHDNHGNSLSKSSAREADVIDFNEDLIVKVFGSKGDEDWINLGKGPHTVSFPVIALMRETG